MVNFSGGALVGDLIVNKGGYLSCTGDFYEYPQNLDADAGSGHADNLTINAGGTVVVQGTSKGVGGDDDYTYDPYVVDGVLTMKPGATILFNYKHKPGEEIVAPENMTFVMASLDFIGDVMGANIRMCSQEVADEGDEADLRLSRLPATALDMELFLDRDWETGWYVFSVGDKLQPLNVTVKGTQIQTVDYSGKGVTFGGSGTIVLQEKNGQGRSIITGATVTATGSDSFGWGNIVLKKGVLDLNHQGVSNFILASGGTIANADAFEGFLDVKGNVTLKGDLSAYSLFVTGTLTGGKIVASQPEKVDGALEYDEDNTFGRDITLYNGTVASNITGCYVYSTGKSFLKGVVQDAEVDMECGSLTISGKLENSYVSVEEGTMTVSGPIEGDLEAEVVYGTLKITGSTDNARDISLNLGYDEPDKAGNVKTRFGTLDLGGKEISGEIVAYGGTITGASRFKGCLSAIGNVKLGGVTTAESIHLEPYSHKWGGYDSGSISGGSIKDAEVSITTDATNSFYYGQYDLRTSITGDSSLEVRGAKVNVYANQTYTGVTSVRNGKLIISPRTTFKSSCVTVGDKGVLEADKLPMHVILEKGSEWYGGGSMSDGQLLELAGGDSDSCVMEGKSVIKLVSGTSSTNRGTLALSGGTVVLGDGASLDIHTLSLRKPVTIDMGLLTDKECTIKFDSLSGDVDRCLVFTPSKTQRKDYSQSITNKSITVTGSTPYNAALMWTATKGNWEIGGSQYWESADPVFNGKAVKDTRFYNGDSVTFNSPATVTLVGGLEPATVTVESDGLVTFSGKGSITGDVELVKSGTGTLKLNATNAYTGSTDISDGKVVATGAESFGESFITLSGGTLDLGGKTVGNAISATGGTLAGMAKYAGYLMVDGTVALSGNLMADELWVYGTLNGGTIKDTEVTLENGSVSSAISGKSSVLVMGESTLSGKLSYTGGTVLAGGGTTAMLTADLTLASKQTLTVGKTFDEGMNILHGKLTLSGGSIELFDGSALTIEGTLDVKKASTLDVITMSAGKSVTIGYDSITGNASKLLTLGIPVGPRKTYTLDVGAKGLTVTVKGENTSLTWQGAKGTWEVCGKQMWGGSSSDNRFYHGDDVTFDTAATVTLSGRLAPGSVTVSGSGNVTFSGKGSIAGSTDLEMSGSGTLKMNTSNTYTGATLIKSGTVVATGADSFGDSYITLTGGTLDFGGKAIANRIIVDGKASVLNGKSYAGMIYLAPGGSLSVNANLTGTLVLGGGTLDLSGLAPKALAKLQFGTVRTLGDDVTINVGDLGLGTYTVMNIKDASSLDTTLLQADGLYGSFELQGSKLVLTVSEQPVVAAAEPEAVEVEEPQAAVEVEEALVTDNPAATSAAAAPLAAYALSNPRVDGIIYTTQASAQIDGNRAAMDTVRDLMGGARMVVGDRGYRFALQATSANSRVKNDSKGMPGYNRNSIGGLLMVEKGLNDHMVAGLTLGHEHTDVRVRGLNTWRSNDTRLGAHLLAGGQSWRSSSYVGFGLHDYDMKRESATGTYTSKPTGYSLNMMEELAAVVAVGETSVIEPFLRVESSLNGINGTHERGGDADGALGIAHQNAWATTFTLGARYAQELRFGGAMRPARLALEAGVSKSVGDEGAQVDVYSWTDRSDRTTLSPAKRDRWGAKLGGSLILPISDAETVNLGASVHLRGTGTEVNANVGYSLAF